MITERTQVAIVEAGPSGLPLELRDLAGSRAAATAHAVNLVGLPLPGGTVLAHG